jgi:xylulose-5-phosphate/fructose-6-phosphate phosphoketolase
VAPETPGSINEGGELGYSLAHALGAVLDNPELIVTCVVGDGEAETGPVATSWQLNKFISAKNDGAVLPVLHLNGYKIANPTVLSRIPHGELESFLIGCGWKPHFVEGDDPEKMHPLMAETLDRCIEDILRFREAAREHGDTTRPAWPMIVLRSPKGWTGPKIVDGKPVEGTFRAHQVPLSMTGTEHLEILEKWLRSYRPEELFTDTGEPVPSITALAPRGERRMGANPHANGGVLLHDLRLPDFCGYAVNVPAPGAVEGSDMSALGAYIRDVYRLNAEEKNFRVFGPDETISNRLGAVFTVENRDWNAEHREEDEFLSPNGRVMDAMLSEHMCEGALEGYLLTGRHGVFNCYEAFIRIVDSMFSQHAKWLKVTKELPWRAKIASLNYLLSSNVWQQDHNGFTHQDPGFLDHVANKKADVVRLFQAPASPVADHGTGHPPLLAGHRHLELGLQRPGSGTARRHGLLRRHAHAGGAGSDDHPPEPFPGAEDPGRERGGPDASAARLYAPPRADRAGVRRHLHQGQADHFRLPRLRDPDSRADLQADEQKHPRPRLQGGGHHHHRLRHAGAE